MHLFGAKISYRGCHDERGCRSIAHRLPLTDGRSGGELVGRCRGRANQAMAPRRERAVAGARLHVIVQVLLVRAGRALIPITGI